MRGRSRPVSAGSQRGGRGGRCRGDPGAAEGPRLGSARRHGPDDQLHEAGAQSPAQSAEPARRRRGDGGGGTGELRADSGEDLGTPGARAAGASRGTRCAGGASKGVGVSQVRGRTGQGDR